MKEERRIITTRNKCDTPILFSGHDQKDLQRGIMYNYCPCGLYFESDIDLKPGSLIQIKRLTSQVQCDYKGEVRWSRENFRRGKVDLGYGVHIRVKCHPVYKGQVPAGSKNSCDLCSKTIYHGIIHELTPYTFLCSSCLSHYDSLGKSIRGSIEDFLIGNIL